MGKEEEKDLWKNFVETETRRVAGREFRGDLEQAARLVEATWYGIVYQYAEKAVRGKVATPPEIRLQTDIGSLAWYSHRTHLIELDIVSLEEISLIPPDALHVTVGGREKQILGFNKPFQIYFLVGIEEADHSLRPDQASYLDPANVPLVAYDSEPDEYRGLGWQYSAAKNLGWTGAAGFLWDRLQNAIGYRYEKKHGSPLRRKGLTFRG